MTKNQVVDLLRHLLLKSELSEGEKLDNTKIKDVHWKLESSGPDSLVFYSMDWSPSKVEHSWKAFLKRIEGASFALLVINGHKDNQRLTQLGLKNLLITSGNKAGNGFLEAQKIVMDHLYPLPATTEGKKLVGVTGTNGKTTTVDLARQISTLRGHKAFSIGTLGVKTWEGLLPTDNQLTTPPFIELRKILYQLYQTHDVGLMEVSSHALAMERIYGFKFHACAWMSFSQDHLDFHHDMEDYFRTKKKLPMNYLAEGGAFFVPGLDQDLLLRLKDLYPTQPLGLRERGYDSLPLFLSTQFNKINLEVALAINDFLWGKPKQGEETDLKKLWPIEGRFSLYRLTHQIFIIDFAHTPDALEKVCQSVKEVFPNKKIVVVFGCGGDRDALKRPKMAAATEKFADQIIVTSDNPRSEDPQKIVDDIVCGFSPETYNSRLKVILDRELAIRTAYKLSTDLSTDKGNEFVILIAGKGHENYQIIKGVYHFFSDQNVLEKLAKEENVLLEVGDGQF